MLKTPARGSIQPWLALVLLLMLLAVAGYVYFQKQPAEPIELPTAVTEEPPQASEAKVSTIEPPSPTDPEQTMTPVTDLQAIIEEKGHLSITGQPIDDESLAAKKAQLLADLTGHKKKPINPSTMDPLMLLEHAQFGRYLEQGQFDLADQLLTEMQENWPDYDFEDMIYQLALAESQNLP